MKVRKTEIIVSVCIILVAAAVFATFARFSAVSTRICATCGARQRQTRWMFGFRSTPAREDAPLTRWLLRQGRTHEHEWRRLDVQGRNVFGRGISAGSTGDPPAISTVRPAVVERFLRSAAERETEEFARLMLGGSEDERATFIHKMVRVTGDQGD